MSNLVALHKPKPIPKPEKSKRKAVGLGVAICLGQPFAFVIMGNKSGLMASKDVFPPPGEKK